jgi:hypothetical protein
MDEYYRHWLGVIYTGGVRMMAETAQAYWLIDAVASYQRDPRVKGEEFQTWTLKVNADKSATLTMTDGNTGPARITQHIEFTDFADSGETECELFLVGPPPMTLMLPSEY